MEGLSTVTCKNFNKSFRIRFEWQQIYITMMVHADINTVGLWLLEKLIKGFINKYNFTNRNRGKIMTHRENDHHVKNRQK